MDILAEHRHEDTVVALPVECKKNNPAFTRWLFFQKSKKEVYSGMSILRTEHREGASARWITTTAIGGIHWPMPLADDGREVRGTYATYAKGDKTKTSNAAIGEACFQVALATQAIFLDEARSSDALARHPDATTPYGLKVLIPTIVTTADLAVCTFDPNDVDMSTGELPRDRASLKKVDALIYEYPLPRQFQNLPEDLASTLLSGGLENFIRMHILVVHSAALQQLLQMLAEVSTKLQSWLAFPDRAD